MERQLIDTEPRRDEVIQEALLAAVVSELLTDQAAGRLQQTS
jgi:hypothetical protein